MVAPTPELTFPISFCCNCGEVNCQSEVQDTRVTRFFGIRGTESTFHLTLPVCMACRKSLRRRPPGFFSMLFVFAVGTGVALLLGYLLSRSMQYPAWMVTHRIAIGAVLGAIAAIVFYRLRSARPPKTSFYQPVRIKQAKVQFGGVMGGPGHVAFLKLAFTNPDYLNIFMNANREAIQAGHVTVVQT
ncbi:MAG TPA: hypothetical protein VFO82_07700 [Steroidobacteraceae bacterium]|nr:hypothetical protein [Steroidobacteraceae bacterium]